MDSIQALCQDFKDRGGYPAFKNNTLDFVATLVEKTAQLITSDASNINNTNELKDELKDDSYEFI